MDKTTRWFRTDSPPVGPCSKCRSAIFVRLATGEIVCPQCTTLPSATVVQKLLWVDDPPGLVDYASELAARGTPPELNDWYFAQMEDEDRQHVLGPHHFPEPCPWCGGRYRHGQRCQELHDSWQIRLPSGAYKNKPVDHVPLDYLEWLLRTARRIEPDLLRAVKKRLQDATPQKTVRQQGSRRAIAG